MFNIGANVRFGITETTARVYRKVWEMACFGGFLMGREAAKVMLPRGRGTILFTGATASLRGREGFAAFAGAKHALRALAQSMARELGPQGHPRRAHVIDGAIDTEFIRTNFPERYALKDQERHPRTPTHRRQPTGSCTASRATPGRTRSTCGPGWRPGEPRPPVDHRNDEDPCNPFTSSSCSTSAAPTPTCATR